MNAKGEYVPGPATGARVLKDGEAWTLLIQRELRHPPALVWEALTEPKHLAQWAPFDADRSLAGVGPVQLAAARAPTPQVAEGLVKRAEAPHLLEYDWGGQNLRWELEPLGSGTRLSLFHNINRQYIAWGAAGWHICLDVLDHLLGGTPLGRIVGPDAIQFGGWQRLNREYAEQFGIESPDFQPKATS